MNKLDLAYLGGLLDGEGTITLTRLQAGRFRTPSVTIALTDREVLDWVKETFGGKITNKKRYKDHHKDSFTWQVDSRKALALLEAVLPHLRIERKRVRAELILSEYLDLTPRNGKYTEEMRAKKLDFEDRFFE